MTFDPVVLDNLGMLDDRQAHEAAAALDVAYSCERNIRSIGGPGPGRIGQGRNEPMSRMVLRPAGDLLLSYVIDQIPTTNEIDGSGLDMFCFTTIQSGRMDLAQEGRRATASDNTGLAFRTALGTRFCSSGGNKRLNLLLHAPLLRRALDALLGEQTHEDIIFVPSLAWDRGVAASLHRQIAFMIAEFGRRDGLVTNSVGLTSYTDFIVQMILRGITHNYTEQLGQGRHGAGPGYLRRAEAFMRAHAGSPVRLDQIAAAAGCSVRSLSLVFRRFRDTTPLAALHAVRLEAVRAELRDRANPATTAEIARRYGFSNSARFVHAYQQRFGEPPPTRLRRGR